MEYMEYKGRRFKTFSHLLALALPSGTGESVLDWCPFLEGNTLQKIVEELNAKSISFYEGQGWSSGYVENLAPILNILSDDLSTVHKLREDDFKDIHIW